MDVPNRSIFPYGPTGLAAAVAAILRGDCVAVPTETVYGLAADATNGAAVAGIYAAKGRPSFNPLIVHVADMAAAEALAVFDDDARALAATFWPGPLTLVLPIRDRSDIAALVTAGLDTIAIRVPRHRTMQALIAATGRPLAAPSANTSGGISPTTAAHVAASLGNAVAVILDDGPTEAGIESTIVATAPELALLRPGPITVEAIADLLGRTPTAHTGGIVAPGQLASHYAPTKPLRLGALASETDEWLIGFGTMQGDDTLSATGDPVEAAARLFDALHRADASEKSRIAIAPVPYTGIGVAINDRLSRAAHR